MYLFTLTRTWTFDGHQFLDVYIGFDFQSIPVDNQEQKKKYETALRSVFDQFSTI